ncbi:MAG: hypothetical protein IT359_12620 [Gemmatimonadaceae bacterium]|nr:hypothetical protein [Gemmatimonadaceae bacterium]
MAKENELSNWFEDVSGPEWIWYAKYLSANDTYAKPNVHQGGPYVAKEVLRLAFPRLSHRSAKERNPDILLSLVVDSHDGYEATLRLVWYNSKRLGQKGGRDEARLTRWGAVDAPVVSADSTGALAVFAYHRVGAKDADALRVWVARTLDEEERIVERVGPVDPGDGVVITSSGVVVSGMAPSAVRSCVLHPSRMPQAWKESFPPGDEIVSRVIESLMPARGLDVDERLLRRRRCEYEVFRSVEAYHVLPELGKPFSTVDAFLEFAHSVTNRRKSRSGRSLELQLAGIFREEGVSFSHGAVADERSRPDFLFPSIVAYRDKEFPRERLRMLAAKTTVKDRWRQVLAEASEVHTKHLLTLQEGVSEAQLDEMTRHNVILVVPEPLRKAFPKQLWSRLKTLQGFLEEVRQDQRPAS